MIKRISHVNLYSHKTKSWKQKYRDEKLKYITTKSSQLTSSQQNLRDWGRIEHNWERLRGEYNRDECVLENEDNWATENSKRSLRRKSR